MAKLRYSGLTSTRKANRASPKSSSEQKAESRVDLYAESFFVFTRASYPNKQSAIYKTFNSRWWWWICVLRKARNFCQKKITKFWNIFSHQQCCIDNKSWRTLIAFSESSSRIIHVSLVERMMEINTVLFALITVTCWIHDWRMVGNHSAAQSPFRQHVRENILRSLSFQTPRWR